MSFARGSVTLVAALLVAGCAPKPHVSQPLSSADETAIRELASNIATTISGSDWDGWVLLFEPDAEVQPPNAKAVRGRDNLLAWGKAFPPVEKLEFSDVKIWGGAGNIAFLTTGYVLKLKDIPPDTGKQLGVARKQADGKWLTAAVSFNSDIPIAPALPPAKK